MGHERVHADEFLPLPLATFHILLAVAETDRHGYGIIQDVAARTDGALKLSAGTLYRSIQRMLEDGLIVEVRERPAPADDDERRRYYRITPLGAAVGARRDRPPVPAGPLRAGGRPGSGEGVMYGALLRLLPASFRGEYATEMRAVFAQRRREASGPLGVALLWIETAWDLLACAIRVHAELFAQDVRYAIRSFRNAPGFTLTAAFVAALGVGATTAAFSVTDHVLVRPLPFKEPHRLIKLWQDQTATGYSRLELSPRTTATGSGSARRSRRWRAGTASPPTSRETGIRALRRLFLLGRPPAGAGRPAADRPRLHAGGRPAGRRRHRDPQPRPLAPPASAATRRCSAGASCSTTSRTRWWASCPRTSASRRARPSSGRPLGSSRRPTKTARTRTSTRSAG